MKRSRIAEPKISSIIEMIPVAGDVLDEAVCSNCGAVIVRQYPDGEWGHVGYRMAPAVACLPTGSVG